MVGFEEVKVLKILRNANKYADILVKYSLNLRRKKFELSDYPSFLYNILLRDIKGTDWLFYFF